MIFYRYKEEDDVVFEKLQEGKAVNRYPFTQEIYYKDAFSKAMKPALESFADEYDFIPPTFEPGAGNRQKENERF